MTKADVLRQAMGRANVKQVDIDRHKIMSKPTISKKLKDPNLFTLSEISKINKLVHFTDDEIKVLCG